MDARYLDIASHYDSRLAEFGDTALGAHWPSQKDRERRFDVMLDVMKDDDAQGIDVLDFACGSGDLLRHLGGRADGRIRYAGADISTQAIEMARRKFPKAPFSCLDIVAASDGELAALASDYCVINGLFTVKMGLSDEEMWSFLTAVVTRLWSLTRKGIAFNVMSKQVDWERDDLFHVSLDRMAAFLHRLTGRNVVFRADYGLYEYTCYAYRDARDKRPGAPPAGADCVKKPLLPKADELLPYLRSIDRRRWYSNWGEVNNELEKRFCSHFSLGEGHCVTASSGTDAITGSLIATAGRASAEKPYCVMPSYTFVATAAAAMNAGYRPLLLDIDPASFALSPRSVLEHPRLAEVGAIVLVAPYGRPVELGAWQALSRQTGIPIVLDAAAGFDAIASDLGAVSRNIPVVLSLHATKVFGTGEGGAILCADTALAENCRRALNFGFMDSRSALVPGINGKMSEYHAAVGLAEFDGWPAKRGAFIRVAQDYREEAARSGLADRVLAETGWASPYILYHAASAADADRVIARLDAAAIDHRHWYGPGLHRQPAYAVHAEGPLPATDDVAPRLIGLPMSVDLSAQEIARVVTALAAAG